MQQLVEMFSDVSIALLLLAAQQLVDRLDVLVNDPRELLQGLDIFGRVHEVVGPQRIEARAFVVHDFLLAARDQPQNAAEDGRLARHHEGFAFPRGVGVRASKKDFAEAEQREVAHGAHRSEETPRHVAADFANLSLVGRTVRRAEDFGVVAEQRFHLLGPLGVDVPLGQRHLEVGFVGFTLGVGGVAVAPAAVLLHMPREAAVVIAERVGVIGLDAALQPVELRIGQR